MDIVLDFLHNCAWPLLRLLVGLCLGIFIANLLEALQWTKFLSKFSIPLANFANLSPCASVAFTFAFISPTQANAILAEHYNNNDLCLRELIIANIFNSFPSYLVHIPTIFFITYPILGTQAFVYVGLCLLSALLRTSATLVYAKIVLPTPKLRSTENILHTTTTRVASPVTQAIKRLKKRLPTLLLFTIPIYLLIYACQVGGVFTYLNHLLGDLGLFNQLLSPETCSIILLHLLAELGSALSAAGALLSTASISVNEIILALLLGNILSTPMRALRHQLPTYAGLYSPLLGLKLIAINQTLRAVSLVLVTIFFTYGCILK